MVSNLKKVWKWSRSVVPDSSNPMDCSLPGSSIHGIFQARVLEWGAIAYFLQFKSEFGNKEFMIWATVSSWSYFCWLSRASPSFTAKNIINLISVLNTWWCPCVESCVACWKRVFAVTSGFSWQNSISLCPASFCTPGPNLPVTAGISWLPTLRERQRRKGKIYPFECRVPKNRKERLESLPQWSVQRNRGKQ